MAEISMACLGLKVWIELEAGWLDFL